MVTKKSSLWMTQGVCSTSGNIHCMYRRNFNMPVPDLFGGSSNCTSGFMSARYVNMCNTSHALSGTWYPGYEFAFGDNLYVWQTGSGETLAGTGCALQRWRQDGTITHNFNWSISINMPENSCCWYESMVNTGVAGWEISGDGCVCFEHCVTCVSGNDISIGAKSGGIILSGVPSVLQCVPSHKSRIWVEGNTLGHINANSFKHYLTGTCQGSGATAGAIWIDNNHYLNWANSGGCWYKAPWRICQFCSTFTNGAGNNPSPGASYAGSIWTDEEFGYTHLAYIGCDGNKYITGAGDYSYT